MKTLLKSVTILDSRSSHHLKKKDVLLDKGEIIKIANSINEPKAKLIKASSLFISPGWIDMKARFTEPGHEYKETIESGLNAALAGGFKYVVTMPDTEPVIDNKSQVQFLIQKSKSHAVKILPSAALSQDLKGKMLSEMFDMQSNGAVMFTDNKNSVGTEMMARALEYSKNFNGLVGSFPFDPGVNPGGMVNESIVSVEMGLKGLSSSSEEIRLQRDIELLKYSGGRMHVILVSTEGSVELIRKAKKSGLKITCAVSAHHIALTDGAVAKYDTNLKVLPPLRSTQDTKAIIKGLKDGTIDAICSDHEPEDHEHKVVEFEYANWGMSSIQTSALLAIDTLKKEMPLDHIVEKLSTSPAKILGIEYPILEEGAKGSWTVFSNASESSFAVKEWKSLSKNSPFLEKSFSTEILM